MFALAVVSVAAYLVLKAGGALHVWPTSVAEQLSYFFTFLSVLLPTFGGAFASIRYLGDFERFCRDLQSDCRKARGHSRSHRAAARGSGRRARLRPGADLVHATDDVVVSEIESWQAVYRAGLVLLAAARARSRRVLLLQETLPAPAAATVDCARRGPGQGWPERDHCFGQRQPGTSSRRRHRLLRARAAQRRCERAERRTLLRRRSQDRSHGPRRYAARHRRQARRSDLANGRRHHRLPSDKTRRRRDAVRADRGLCPLRRRRLLHRRAHARQRAATHPGADGPARPRTGARRSARGDPRPVQHRPQRLSLRDERQRRAPRRALHEHQLVPERLDGHLGHGRDHRRDGLGRRDGDSVQVTAVRRFDHGLGFQLRARHPPARRGDGVGVAQPHLQPEHPRGRHRHAGHGPRHGSRRRAVARGWRAESVRERRRRRSRPTRARTRRSTCFIASRRR